MEGLLGEDKNRDNEQYGGNKQVKRDAVFSGFYQREDEHIKEKKKDDRYKNGQLIIPKK